MSAAPPGCGMLVFSKAQSLLTGKPQHTFKRTAYSINLSSKSYIPLN